MIRRALRGLRIWSRAAQSRRRLLWYRCLFAGFSAAKRVSLGRDVDINLLNAARLAIGEGSVVEPDVQVYVEGQCAIGRGAFIGRGSVIAAAQSVQIGDDALIAAYVTIRDQDHGVELSDIPYNRQEKASAPITIGNNVWLGTHVTVLKGVTIGDGCVVGANSVVTHDLPSRTICAGVPARPLRHLT